MSKGSGNAMAWGFGGLGAFLAAIFAASRASGSPPNAPKPTDPVVPVTAKEPGTLEGIDVSHWQGMNIDWNKVKAFGIDFAILKASQNDFADPRFIDNAKASVAAAMPFVGGYHYGIVAKDPIKQAQVFSGLVSNHLGDSDRILLPSLDLEWTGNAGAHKSRVLPFIRDFRGEVGARLNRRVMIYTNVGWWGSIGDASDKGQGPGREESAPFLGDSPLWVAHWTSAAKPLVPPAWVNWSIWQYSAESGPKSHEPVPGIPSSPRMDRNRFRGSLQDMKNFVQWSRL